MGGSRRSSQDGERLWGDAGRTFVAVSPAAIDFLNAAANPAGITLAWIANPSGVYAEDLITAMMVDVDGNVMWDPSPMDAATTLSDKGRLVAKGVADGCTRLVWTDERSGTIDLA